MLVYFAPAANKEHVAVRNHAYIICMHYQKHTSSNTKWSTLPQCGPEGGWLLWPANAGREGLWTAGMPATLPEQRLWVEGLMVKSVAMADWGQRVLFWFLSNYIGLLVLIQPRKGGPLLSNCNLISCSPGGTEQDLIWYRTIKKCGISCTHVPQSNLYHRFLVLISYSN